MELQETFSTEVVEYLAQKKKMDSFKLYRFHGTYLLILCSLFFLFVYGYHLDGSNIKVTTTTTNVLGDCTNNYTDSKYDDVILMNDTVGVDDDTIGYVKDYVAGELSYLSNEFVEEFLQRTKFEIEIRDSYCYSDGFGRNYYLHWLDRFNFFGAAEGTVNGYYEGDQGILRVHVYIQEEDISITIRESLLHELGHYYDTADLRFSSSDEFMALYEKYSQREYIHIAGVYRVLPNGQSGNIRPTSYPLTASYELFAEMFQQYIKYPNFVQEEYPDIYEYFKNLIGE